MTIILDLFYLTYIAFMDSAFIKVFFLILLYAIGYVQRMPEKDPYYQTSKNKKFKPSPLFLDNQEMKDSKELCL